MQRHLIFDLPVRVFHALLATGFTAAAILALALGEHHRLFPYHALIGLMLAGLVLLRLLWAFVGTRHARLGSFLHTPGALLKYLIAALTGRGERHAAHNPASAYAALAMFALILGLAVTGIMMARGNDAVEELHEIMVYTFIAVTAAHLLGLALHTVRHGEPICLSMLDGRKQTDDPSAAIPSARPLAALALILITGAATLALARAYDPTAQTLHLPGLTTPLQIGDPDHHNHHDRH